MTGGIVVQNLGASMYKRVHLESDPDQWPPRFTKLELDLEGGGKVAFVDSRRFGRVRLQVDPASREPLSRLGFDVLSEMPPLEEFCTAVRQRGARGAGAKIKALLLDQEFCSGIGNWVGDEVRTSRGERQRYRCCPARECRVLLGPVFLEPDEPPCFL
ncbi:hypothetical protein Agub_g1962, partial [Astrephomene gubernaculifera]